MEPEAGHCALSAPLPRWQKVLLHFPQSVQPAHYNNIGLFCNNIQSIQTITIQKKSKLPPLSASHEPDQGRLHLQADAGALPALPEK